MAGWQLLQLTSVVRCSTCSAVAHVRLFSTGFGSVFLSIFSVVRPGDEILVADPVYYPTRLLTQDFLKPFNIKTIND